MAMLLLDRATASNEGSRAPSLCAWLRGDWALLFSHPDDFAQYDVEADRWLVLLQQTFTDARTRAIAIASDAHSHQGWLSHINAGCTRVRLTAASPWSHIVDFRSRALRKAIACTETRFVMIIDASLRLRRTFAYSRHDRVPSVFDLIEMAVRVRERSVASDDVRVPSRQPASVRRSRSVLAARCS
jgi:alkyl hydroperoxide reductase subunit AhpC